MGWERFISSHPVINKSFIYLLPMVGISLGLRRNHLIDFAGIFVKNEDYPELGPDDKLLYLLFHNFENSHTVPCRKVLEKSCISYDPDDASTMYVFTVPDEYKREYNKFIQSKYSEFSDNYKHSIIKFHDYRESINPRGMRDGSKILDILYRKEAAYKRQEEVLNMDLPRSSWISIPRDQEIGKKWNENPEIELLETYSKDLKLKEVKQLKN